jgi:hypothetical protein
MQMAPDLDDLLLALLPADYTWFPSHGAPLPHPLDLQPSFPPSTLHLKIFKTNEQRQFNFS